MLKVNVHSTESERDAYVEIEVEDEDQVMNLLQGARFAQLLGKWLEEG